MTYLLGVSPYNVGQVLVLTAAGSVLAVIFGFYIGSIADNQISGVGALKIGGTFFLLAPILTTVIPKAYHLFLYWVPTYWTYLGYRAIFMDGEPWVEILRFAGINLVVNFVVLALSWRPLGRRLSLRG